MLVAHARLGGFWLVGAIASAIHAPARSAQSSSCASLTAFGGLVRDSAMKTERAPALGGGPAPLYHQLEQELRRRIKRKEFGPGEALPTEERICAQYGVSRITVRRALDALIAEGWITKRRGVGTFVNAPAADGVRSVRLSGSLDDFLASAGSLGTQVLSMAEVIAPDEAARGLRLADGDSCTRLELLSFLEEKPLGHHLLYLPVAVGRRVRPADVAANLPVIRMVEDKLGAHVARAEQFLEADVAGEVAAKYLGLRELTPVMKVTRIYYDTSGVPMEMIVARNHPERYRYSIDFVARPRIV